MEATRVRGSDATRSMGVELSMGLGACEGGQVAIAKIRRVDGRCQHSTRRLRRIGPPPDTIAAHRVRACAPCSTAHGNGRTTPARADIHGFNQNRTHRKQKKRNEILTSRNR